jgi:hypothetical protein
MIFASPQYAERAIRQVTQREGDECVDDPRRRAMNLLTRIPGLPNGPGPNNCGARSASG